MEEETLKKFHDMKCLMADEMEPGKGCTGSGKAHKVGIIADFWEENTFGWLHQALSSYHFSEIIKRILFINTSDKDIKKVFKMMSSCSFYVYICSGYNRETFPAMRQRLGLLSERRNLIIIIHNLEDSSERKKETILQENGNRVPFHNVFLFSKMDLGWNYLSHLVNDHQPGSARRRNKGSHSLYGTSRNPSSSSNDVQEPEKMKISKGSHSLYGTSRNPSNNYDDPREPEIMKNRKGISATHPISSKDSRRVSERPAASDVFDNCQRHPSARRRVGIFSRSTERDYRWLVETLRSEDFSSLVANVKSCFIHNKQPFQKFLDDINHCTFGILYHSKNRGRVNVTDVTDSLYDQELETLCMILGKKNVGVIIDDLEDSSDYRKRYVLQEQPRIVKQAADLLLVSDDDKMDSGLLRRKTDQLKKLLRDAAPGSDLSSCV